MRLVAALLMLSLGGLPPGLPDLAFTVPTQGQRTVSDYRGKVVAVEFFYTTCTQCAPSVQMIQKLEQEFGNQGFQAIAVAFNPNAEVLVEDFTKEHHLAVPVGWSLGNDVSAFLGYGPEDRFVVPQIVLIDRAGKIRFRTKAQGEDSLRNEPVLRQRITELLQPPQPNQHLKSQATPSPERKRR
jgi:peroxiredoxin